MIRRQIGEPRPGYYKRRLCKGGPFVSVRFFEVDGDIHVEVDGETEHKGKPFDPYEEWPLCWPSTEDDHKFFAELRAWATKHKPDHPAARPRSPIDLGAMPARTRP